MLRRCTSRLAAVAATAMTHDVQTVPKDTSAEDEPVVAVSEMQKTEYKHVHTLRPTPFTFIPSAIEAPERLQTYVEPKPFISVRRMQVFLVSFGIGAMVMAFIYFVLSKSVSTRVEEEQSQLDRVAERNRVAMQDRLSIVPNFAAPSSYDELYAKMLERDKEVEQLMTQSRSTLHTETTFHVKMWWNRCLQDVQMATDNFLTAQARRKEAQVEANIESTVRYNGYHLVRLERE